jgi:hypothetical protein
VAASVRESRTPFPGGLRLALGFEQQLARVERKARIDGRIETEAPAEGPLVVVLGRVLDDGKLVGVDSFIRVRPGTYAFPVDPGRYQVGAYEDRNQNGLLDPGERTAANSDAPVLELGAGEEVAYDIRLAADATTPPSVTQPINVLEIVARTPSEQREFSLWAWSAVGRICRHGREPGATRGPGAGRDDPRLRPEPRRDPGQPRGGGACEPVAGGALLKAWRVAVVESPRVRIEPRGDP